MESVHEILLNIMVQWTLVGEWNGYEIVRDYGKIIRLRDLLV